MKSFKEFFAETRAEKDAVAKIELFEHEIYKLILGSKNSYRTDPGNTNTVTLKHSHIYAKLKGRGKELYSARVGWVEERNPAKSFVALANCIMSKLNM